MTSGVDRRSLVAGGLAGLGALAFVGCERDAPQASSSGDEAPAATDRPGTTWKVASGPPRQSGVTTWPGGHAHWVGFDLPGRARRDDLRRALVLLDEAGRRFVTGRLPLPDVATELAADPGAVAIAVGVGPAVFDLPGMRATPPDGFAPVPKLAIDRFEKPWGQSDLMVQVDADNPLTVSHVATQLVLALKGTATPRWQQCGFHAGARPGDRGITRNLFGQLDGQEQPDVAGADSDRVWNPASARTPWLEGTTSMVIRRIRMDVDVWQSLDRTAQENAVGRRLSDGAPLTGGSPADPVDLDAKDSLGFTVVNPAAHVARARRTTPEERILRRPYNYETPRDDGTSDRGLVFVAFCANVARQYVPIQRRLAEADLLNRWTTPIGSAVYLLPAAPRPGQYLAQTLLEAGP